MHLGAYEFVQQCVRRLDDRRSVLEIGGRDVNGSIRGLFQAAESYISIDLRPGPGVDLVADGGTYRTSKLVDTVVCCETLEHAEHPERIIQNAYENLEPFGILIVTTVNPDWPAHSVDGESLPDGQHYQGVFAPELRYWISQSGFDIIQLETASTGAVYAMASKGRIEPKPELPVEESPPTVEIRQSTTCDICHRALWVEDGPICPECRERST